MFSLYPQLSYVQHGRYVFSPGTTALAALAKIHKGDVVIERLTIPEGITARDLFDRLSEHEALGGQVSLVKECGDTSALIGLPMRVYFLLKPICGNKRYRRRPPAGT